MKGVRMLEDTRPRLYKTALQLGYLGLFQIHSVPRFDLVNIFVNFPQI